MNSAVGLNAKSQTLTRNLGSFSKQSFIGVSIQFGTGPLAFTDAMNQSSQVGRGPALWSLRGDSLGLDITFLPPKKGL